MSPSCARGGSGDKTLSSTTSRSNPRAGRSREAEALGHARLPSTVDRGARADWTLSRAQHNIHAKSHLRKHSGLFSRPVIILPEPGAVVRFASCNTCDERGDRRQQEAIFGGLLRARGVTRQKSPGRGDLLAAKEGRTGDWSGACWEVVLGPPRSCRTSREAEARGPVLRACPGQTGARPACVLSVNPG